MEYSPWGCKASPLSDFHIALVKCLLTVYLESHLWTFNSIAFVCVSVFMPEDTILITTNTF